MTAKPDAQVKNTPAKTVAVIGAGIVGVATALWLQRDGHRVTLIDKAGVAEGASFGNAGILASCGIVPVTTPGLIAKAPRMLMSAEEPLYLKWRYLPRLLPWLRKYLKHANPADNRRIASALTQIIGDSLEEHQALSEGTDGAGFVRASDYAYIYRDRAAFEADRFSWDLRLENGFSWRELEGNAVRERFPAMGSSQGFAALLPGHGYISDPGKYVRALASTFEKSGGRIIIAAVEGIAVENGRLDGVRFGGTLEAFDAVAICAGAWSARLMKQLGLPVPLESERGYHVEFWNPSQTTDAPLLHAAGKFGATPMDGRIRCAGIVEFGGLDAPPSNAPFDLLERRFKEAFPAVTFEHTERWMGHRPAIADSIPVIGEIEHARGVFAGFGHHHVGLTGGPKTGRLLAQLIGAKKPNIDLAPYNPMRFD